MKLQVQPQYSRHEEWLKLAKDENFTFEVSELAIPLQDEYKRQKVTDWYKNTGLVTSVHGAFIDINPVSAEPDIAKISKRLIEGSCQLSVDLGAKNVVFHGSAFPFLRGEYVDNWVEKTTEYFLHLAEKYELKILIENSTDLDPEALYRLMRGCNDPKIRICLDVGHINYSREPQQTWFEMLGDYVDYVHFSDNFGAFDDHLPIGTGTVPWQLVNDLCKMIDRELIGTLETGTYEQTLNSIDYLKEHRYLVWDPDMKKNEEGVRLDLDLTPEEKEAVRRDRAERRAITLQNRNELLGRVFRRYLSNDIVQQVLNDPHGLSLGGRKAKVTVLMTDLHAFTAATEHLEAQKMLQILNHYYAQMHEVTARFNGTVIDMIGDGLLVAFGLFSRDENHADLAIACALQMIGRMDAINEWNEAHGFPEVHMGVGIDTGEVVAGNIGSSRHIKYGLVGRAINMCSRIETYTMNEQILVSEDTVEASSAELSVYRKFAVLPKGSDEKITLYDITGIGAPYRISHKPLWEDFTPVAKQESIMFRFANDKHIDPIIYRGAFIELGMTGGIFKTDVRIETYDNLQLDLGDAGGSLFCMVGLQEESGFVLHFTALPPRYEAWFKTMVGDNKPRISQYKAIRYENIFGH